MQWQVAVARTAGLLDRQSEQFLGWTGGFLAGQGDILSKINPMAEHAVSWLDRGFLGWMDHGIYYRRLIPWLNMECLGWTGGFLAGPWDILSKINPMAEHGMSWLDRGFLGWTGSASYFAGSN
jgi:hypothetical protein